MTECLEVACGICKPQCWICYGLQTRRRLEDACPGIAQGGGLVCQCGNGSCSLDGARDSRCQVTEGRAISDADLAASRSIAWMPKVPS